MWSCIYLHGVIEVQYMLTTGQLFVREGLDCHGYYLCKTVLYCTPHLPLLKKIEEQKSDLDEWIIQVEHLH